jgi:DNA-binding NarL/FixJ family response regulator
MAQAIKSITYYDAATGETINREMNAEELESHQAIQAEAEARQAETDAKVSARESALAKLAALGLTADEVAAL